MSERPSRIFAFRLCLALGYPHPDHLLREISALQLAEWEAYSKVEPFGFPIDSFRFGQICASVANFSFGSKKRNYTAQDFTPEFKSAAPPDPKTLSQKILSIFRSLVR